ncbi:MAG TPA: outer membrane beta-barrel protein [Chryseolinea sp.]|nr:outer membrane beta-barrel protein [Chryseolinea sp.]
MLYARIIFFLSLATGIAGSAMAQNECELILVQATDEFNAGHLYGIPAMLKDCLDKNENREWRQRAYLLLSETYLLLEDPIGAEQSYLNVLWANPEFVTDETRDPIDLVYLSRKFTATPIFSFHGYAGPNISPVRVIHDVRIGGESYTDEKYQMRLGWQVGVGMDFNYNDYLSASLGVNYQQTSFKHTTTELFGRGKDIVDFIDHQNWAAIPLAVKYSQAEGKIRRYVYAGYSFNFLLGDKADVEINNRDDKPEQKGEYSSFDKSISNISLKQNRSATNGAFFVGGGLKYKYNLDYFYVDMRYSLGIKNLVKLENRFESVVEGLPFPYVDDDLRLDNLAISVGYIHPLYKPRKLKNARTKSVLRKIEKEDNATN